MIYKAARLLNNYFIARWRNRPSTATFWYLPERLHTPQDTQDLALYPIDFRSKRAYSLENREGIIVLPYDEPIGRRVNPEAAFQYALGCHDAWRLSGHAQDRDVFLRYAAWFAHRQTAQGLWEYEFDWFEAKAPWSSALAQARGASVMARALSLTGDEAYREHALAAFRSFAVPIEEGGFLHVFSREACVYFEEYPPIPTGVINGFMSALISLWDVNRLLEAPSLVSLWETGIASLEKMLPYYSTGWWSLYDLDAASPVRNVNSPRYHWLECQYLQVLARLASSAALQTAYENRLQQYHHPLNRWRALGGKAVRKILYR